MTGPHATGGWLRLPSLASRRLTTPARTSGRDRPSGGEIAAFWSIPVSNLLTTLNASPRGLTAADAAQRLARHGPNVLAAAGDRRAMTLLLRQFGSPIVLLLIVAAALSIAVRDPTDGVIILGIVVASGLLGFRQEYGAANIVAALAARVELRTTVLRDGAGVRIPIGAVVPGDVILASAGSGIPADCRVLESRDLFVNEATLTGESFPVEKSDGEIAAETPLARRTNALFMGTHVVSGTAHALVVRTGRDTEFGHVSARVQRQRPPTEFERGLHRFGSFLIEVTLVLVAIIFALNVYLAKPVLDSFLFALALAVGLTPQLLPAIISVNLAKGAKSMADRKVVVKRLTAIENFGSMDVLCSDKTGTLTEGQVALEAAVDPAGHESDRVWLYAYVNATLQAGYVNPIDTAIRTSRPLALTGWAKADEIPYDFIRRRLSVLAVNELGPVLISKGALAAVLRVCSHAAVDGTIVPIDGVRASIERLQAAFEGRGCRTLGVAVREMPAGTAAIRREDEAGLTLLGVLALHDPPKAGAAAAVAGLAGLGVSLKIVTGDSVAIAGHVAEQVGLVHPVTLSGEALRRISDEALPIRAARVDVFAEVEPGQKERIIRALQRGGHVVGYIGDGINDAPALHTADVGISVQDAADAAKAAADIVLLEQDLGVLQHGVREGRRTFANTLKYVFMATSANFGNMFSMAGASVFLPFLPLLPKQVLLLNLLTDLPELTIATDRVDADWIERPRRWDIRFIRRFMVVFGALSSVFDYFTFAVLLWWLGAGPTAFRTGWFLESLVSAALIVLVVRTRQRILTTPPSKALAVATAAAIAVALLLPFAPFAAVLGFAPVHAPFILAMIAIVAVYVVAAEGAKRWFYRWDPHSETRPM